LNKNEEVNVDYWGNGNKKVETHYKDGSPDGLTTGWYESGKKKGETHYKNGNQMD
jgi:antitoxin component YwqK of YwqJK toxin-antitoxin module